MFVLIVEDEYPLRALMSAILRRAGHHPIVAESGKRAIQLIDQHRGEFGAVLADYMPFGVRGPDIISYMRPSYPGIPMVLTADIPGLVDETWRRNHDVRFVRKPYTLSQVLHPIERLELGPA